MYTKSYDHRAISDKPPEMLVSDRSFKGIASSSTDVLAAAAVQFVLHRAPLLQRYSVGLLNRPLHGSLASVLSSLDGGG
jgi:hypothetical protein